MRRLRWDSNRRMKWGLRSAGERRGNLHRVLNTGSHDEYCLRRQLQTWYRWCAGMKKIKEAGEGINTEAIPKCPSTGEGIISKWRVRFIHTMEYYWAMKRDGGLIMLHTNKHSGMNLENGTQSGRSLTKRPYVTRLHLPRMLGRGKSIETESRLLIARGWRKTGERWLRTVSGFFGGNENVLEVDSGDGARLWKCTKNHWIVRL